jgi:hypothetical protein
LTVAGFTVTGLIVDACADASDPVSAANATAAAAISLNRDRLTA